MKTDYLEPVYYTHNARPSQILVVVPLVSGGQVVEAVQVLQESRQERDGARLLHQTGIDGEEEDNGHHQLRQQHSY